MMPLADLLTLDLGRASGNLYMAFNSPYVQKSEDVRYTFTGNNIGLTHFKCPAGDVHVARTYDLNGEDLVRLHIKASHDVYEQPREGLDYFLRSQEEIIELTPWGGMTITRREKQAEDKKWSVKTASIGAIKGKRTNLINSDGWEYPSLMLFHEMHDAMRDPLRPLFKGGIFPSTIPDRYWMD
jgi:hypothetical protein